MIRRAFELGWPTVLVIAVCLGLGASNWIRLPPQGLEAGLLLGAMFSIVVNGGRRFVVIGMALVVLGLFWGQMRMEVLGRSVLAGRIGETSSARVVVTGPVRRSPYSVRAAAEVRRFGDEPLRERVELVLRAGRSPPLGAVLEVRGQLVEPRGPETGFDERGWLARGGVHVVLRASDWRIVGRRGGIGGVADRLRAHTARALALGTSGERRALLQGIVLGADEGVSEELRNAFRASGLYHLMAVSGQNVALVAAGMLLLGMLLGVGRLAVEALTVGTIGAYVLAVGWQPSVVRAGVAGGLAALAWFAGRPRDRWHFMALGALVLLAWTPTALLEPGFQLSFAAVAAIFVVVPRLERRLDGYALPPKLVELAVVAVACGAVTAPIVWLTFGSAPVWTVPANVAAEPAMPPLLGCGLVAAVLEPVSPHAAASLSWLAGWCAAWIALCARVTASLPFARSGSLVVATAPLLGAGAIYALRRLPRYRRSSALVFACASAFLLAGAWWLVRVPPRWQPPSGLRMTALDVGQGDGILLEVTQGAVLIDAGPPEAAVDGQLRKLGVRSLAALVLTHPHRDHVGGAPAVLDHLRVGVLLDPRVAGDWPDERRALREAAARGVPVATARAGSNFRLGRLLLTVLWPDGPGLPGENPHHHGVVLLATFGQTDLMLTGDAESEVTGRLPLRSVEVLKVAHHGSEDPGLAAELKIWRPQVAVISVGAHNDFGHPRPETIAALRAVPGLRVLRTDINGRIVIESDGRSLVVRTDRGLR